MAIAFDASEQAFSGSNVASLTTPAFVIGGSNRYLVAGTGSGAGTRQAVTAVKWGGSGGTGLTQQGSAVDFSPANPYFRTTCWGLLAPTAQSATLYASWASNQDETALAGASYTGVDQATPTGTLATATANLSGGTQTPAPTVDASTVADDWVVDIVWVGDTSGASRTITAGAGQTAREEVEGANLVYECLGLSDEIATGATTTMSWSISGSVNGGWGMFALPLKPVSGAVAPKRLTLLGVG